MLCSEVEDLSSLSAWAYEDIIKLTDCLNSHKDSCVHRKESNELSEQAKPSLKAQIGL